ncbi:MAG: hypothetical protein JWN14_690 [Chthonomonadales bacterium]|nr:hypothetical protein [Chthonomonadales bacterium]
MGVSVGKRVVLLSVLVLIAGLVINTPAKPPVKIWMVTGEVALLAFFLLCLGIYDLVRRASYRPAIPLVWLTLAVGLGCFSMGLRAMAQTWGQRLAQLPTTQVGQWFGVGTLFLLVGVVGFGLACQKRNQMSLHS